jgi:flagellar motor protein MotB
VNRFRRIGVIVGALFVAAWAIGCASGAGGGSSAAANLRGAPAAVKGLAAKANGVVQQQDATSGSAGLNMSNPQPEAPLPQIGPKIIKVADVDVALPRGGFQDGLQQAVQIAGRYQGFVLSTTVSSSGPPSGTVVMRVPESRFEAAVADLKGLGKVTRENVSGQDVSQEFVDFQARLRNAKAQEAVLLRLMDRANSVSATIRVEQQLEGVQLSIERLKGQLRYLGSQTAMSTITVGFSQVGVVAQHDGSIQKAWHQAGAAFLSVISSVIVGAAYVLPVGLLALLVLVAVRWWRPRMSA